MDTYSLLFYRDVVALIVQVGLTQPKIYQVNIIGCLPWIRADILRL